MYVCKTSANYDDYVYNNLSIMQVDVLWYIDSYSDHIWKPSHIPIDLVIVPVICSGIDQGLVHITHRHIT